MAKPELGEKRVCGNCSAKFYDLNRDPIVCPKCGTVFEVAAAEKPAPERESKKPVEQAENEDDKDDVVAGGPEIISLEDADEDEGETVDGDDIPDDVGVDIEDDDDDANDDTFLATDDDDDDDDVSGILPVSKDDDDS